MTDMYGKYITIEMLTIDDLIGRICKHHQNWFKHQVDGETFKADKEEEQKLRFIDELHKRIDTCNTRNKKLENAIESVI